MISDIQKMVIPIDPEAFIPGSINCGKARPSRNLSSPRRESEIRNQQAYLKNRIPFFTEMTEKSLFSLFAR